MNFLLKILLGTVPIFLAAAQLFAQANPPLKLALVAEFDEAAPAVDLLTAQLSADNHFQLLERDAIDRVYREQGLSAANRDDLKLGRILGADGLVLLNVVRTSRATNLMARLIAVKPGVILTDGSFDWPQKDLAAWAQSTAAYLDSFQPRLAVQAQDAIPISVVNLRSAIQSSDELETEHELKLLAIQRLSREPRFFVLEREKMQMLDEEKNLNIDEAAFWDGSYLLEGVVDQNGYSQDIITIDARLNPPRGGAPILFKVSGSRTNLAEVINALATNVTRCLNIQSTIGEWNAADEASQYFNEATWALKWGVNEEAQAASESAWALGKRDLDCAMIRVKAYVNEVPIVEGVGEGHFLSMADYTLGKEDPHYTHINDAPNPEDIDRVLYALEAYYEFCHNSPDGLPKILSRGPGWNDRHNSDWYQLGIDTLTAASHVLQHYWYLPPSQVSVVDELTDLRARARSVAGLISASPSVHDSYFVGDRIATYDELAHTMQENPNIFRCEAAWGCFWQERPEDALSLYRELMSSPVFCYIHNDFWNRKPIQPRLVAWNKDDEKNLPPLWNNFVQELGNSTNVLWQMESKALMHADATNDIEAKAAEAGWWSLVRSHREDLIANNVDLFYLGWGFAYNSETETMEREYHDQTIPARETAAVFEKQKQYLASFNPYDFPTFMKVFSSQNYTRAQAAELLPLVIAYESNLVANVTGQKLFFAKANRQWIGMVLENPINQILNPPALPINAAAAQNVHAPLVTAGQPPVAPALSPPPAQVPVNIFRVTHFVKIPFDQIQSNDISGDQIFAQRWSEGKLLFGVAYNKEIYTFDAQGNWQSTREASLHAIAIFNPANETWEIVKCPRTVNSMPMTYAFLNYNKLIILFHGKLFSSLDGPLQKWDFQSGEWQNVGIPEADQCDLFSVDGNLYGASRNNIFELMDDGTIRILAATRRRPAVTTLDSLDAFDSPQLFAGADQSLCASIGKNIYRWDGNDWREILTMENSQPPEIFDDAIIFRNIPSVSDARPCLWIWDKKQPLPELCLLDKPLPHPGIIYSSPHIEKAQYPAPLWKSLPEDYLTRASATFSKFNLYFIVDHLNGSGIKSIGTATEQDGYQAKFVCLSPGLSQPVVVPLKFDIALGPPPLKTVGLKNQPWLDFNVFGLDTTMYFSGHTLFLNQRNSPGVWSVSVPELESAIAVQKQIQLAQIEQEKAALKKAHDDLVAKYDKNHNGVIDPDEREDALDDPAFIESELDQIDANHDGWLEADELAYFDANHNQILDAKEQAGIDIAQHLLAIRLMNKFDDGDKGFLTSPEFDDLQRSCTGDNRRSPGSQFQFPGAYPTKPFHLQDVEGFLKTQTSRNLRLPGSSAAVLAGMQSANAPMDRHLQFKLEVEYYWKNPSTHSN